MMMSSMKRHGSGSVKQSPKGHLMNRRMILVGILVTYLLMALVTYGFTERLYWQQMLRLAQRKPLVHVEVLAWQPPIELLMVMSVAWPLGLPVAGVIMLVDGYSLWETLTTPWGTTRGGETL
jgi:hypothetical protein